MPSIHLLSHCSLTLASLAFSCPAKLRPRSTIIRFTRDILASSNRFRSIWSLTVMDPADPAASDDYISIDGPVSPLRHELGPGIESLVQSITSEADEAARDMAGKEHGDGVGDGVAAADVGIDRPVVEEESGVGIGDDVVAGEEKTVLPEQLLRHVVVLRCDSAAEGGVCNVFIVGTAHVSQKSCEEVRAVIDLLKPQVVFLELCSSRVTVLTPQNLKVANQLEVFPGAEFRVAFEEAQKYGGKVVLGDRPIQITLRRTWAKMPRWHKIKLIYSLLFQAVFLPTAEDLNKMLKEMDDVDMLTLVIQEMSKQYPTLMETIVHERDQYMSSTLLKVASEHNSVVAVVGKGHLQGIKKNWKQPVEMMDLLRVDLPSQKRRISAVKILTTVGVAAVGAAIISGIYISSKKK